jgi:hypothetical protein
VFGFLEVDVEHRGIRLAIAVRNSHDKTFALGMVAGYRCFCCDNLAFSGEFEAIARKHTKHVNLTEVVAMGVDRVQRHFVKLTAHVDAWRNFSLSDARAKEVIYDAFIGDQLEAPKHLAKVVNRHYFDPQHDEFVPRNMWSLENAFTSAFAELDPLPRFKATGKLPAFLANYN